MCDKHSVEERLAKLEDELVRLKGFIAPQPGMDWLKACGTFKDDPDFEELLRLGREFRNSCSDNLPA